MCGVFDIVDDTLVIADDLGGASLRPTQLPSNVKNIDGSIEGNDEKKEESDSEIGNQEEGVVETREDSSETENVESKKNEGDVESKEEDVESKEEGVESKEEGVENKDDKEGVEDKEDAESKEAMNVEEEGKEEQEEEKKKKPETEIQASENVKTGGLPGKKKRKNVYFANVVNKHRRRRRGSRSRYDSKSTSESTADSADSADSAELENDNSTSPANSFFKIPKKPMALRKLSRYLRLLEPNENVLSNHTYELVLFTTADSQVECQSTTR